MRRVLPFFRFSLVIFLLTALACPAISGDIQTLIKDAEGGNPKAQLYLGIAYRKGEGVPRDYAEAMKWYRMAAEQGHAGAQCILGISYNIGQGVPQDYLLAYFWTSLASKSKTCGGDDRRAGYFYMDYAANAARQLNPEQLTKAQQMIRAWEEKHPRK
jgi:TPR repeat protein